MRSSDTPPGQRARSKAPDFSELFRSANSSRHSPRTGAGARSSPSSSPSPGEKPGGAKAPGRRSMLPFLGRKKLAEQTAMPAVPLSRKSVGSTAYPASPVNTVRRSFGNGHAVLMITPSSQSLSAAPPLPPTPSSVDAHATSLGSKLAAHFTPLRSPPRNSKPRPTPLKPAVPASSLAALSPPVSKMRAPSIESERSSSPSRSTTPRPLGGPSSTAENGDEEDFSDLFTRPDQLRKLPQSPKTPTTSIHIQLGDSPKKSTELTPTTPNTPMGPPLHFPIPPSMIIPPRSLLADKSLPRYSSELGSLSSQGSENPTTHQSPVRVDSGRTPHCSQDERHSRHRRTTSVSGSDTDTSRANDSIYSAPSRKLSSVIPKPPSIKSKLSSSSVTQASNGPPPSIPLPSPPLSTNVAALCPCSAPTSTSPNRVVFPRPRANTLSITSNLVVPVQALPKSAHSSPPRSIRANSDAMSGATVDELREALSQQRRKNIRLQEYVITITKRYEDERMSMAKNIEKLERNIRKKMREIEGLRWLVIHNGGVSDIDAAANLARSSFSTHDDDPADAVRRPSPLLPSPVASHVNGPSFQSMSGQQGASIVMTMANSTAELCSDALGSPAGTSFLATSVLDTASVSTTASLTVIPERIDKITRAERQRLKEERRASKALRRISAASSSAMGTDVLSQSSSTDSTLDPTFDPKQSMDVVLEKLEPFRYT